MAAIKGKNTAPEMTVRRHLHRSGLRFRLHDRTLAGRPDLVLPRYRFVVFVHGCFWHHHGCANSTWPRTRATFWRTKINANRRRDRKVERLLQAEGWSVATIWECEVTQLNLDRLVRRIRGRPRGVR